MRPTTFLIRRTGLPIAWIWIGMATAVATSAEPADTPAASAFALQRSLVWQLPDVPTEQHSPTQHHSRPEAAMLADAGDGRLDTHSLLRATLIACGHHDATTHAAVEARLAQLAERLGRSHRLERLKPTRRAAVLFDGLHRRVLRGSYGIRHTDLKRAVAQGDYNCSLIRTIEGKLITLNFDTNSPHPLGFTRIQGTKGVFTWDRGKGGGGRKIYLDG